MPKIEVRQGNDFSKADLEIMKKEKELVSEVKDLFDLDSDLIDQGF